MLAAAAVRVAGWWCPCNCLWFVGIVMRVRLLTRGLSSLGGGVLGLLVCFGGAHGAGAEW